MGDLLVNWKKVKNVVDELRCNKHNKKAVVSLNAEGVGIESKCCEEFKEICAEAATNEIGQQSIEYTKKFFRGLR